LARSSRIDTHFSWSALSTKCDRVELRILFSSSVSKSGFSL